MITVNGVDLLATAGFVAANRPRLLRLPVARAAIAEIPGGIPIRTGLSTPPALLVVDGTVSRTSHTNLLAALDTLAAALRGECVIQFSDIADREWVGTLDPSSVVEPLYAPWIARAERASLVFALPDPRARAQSITSIGGLNPALVLATSESLLSVAVQNGAGAAITRIVIAVRSGALILRSLQWDGSVASGMLWQLAMDPAWEVTNGGANAIDGLTTTSEWPIADPADGADNLLVTITGGASPTVTTSYRRRW